jgi:hypothetical protein
MGGHSDPISTAVIALHGTGGDWNPYADRARRTGETIAWVVKTALRDRYQPQRGPLAQLLDELPAMRPATAAHLRRWLDDEDHAVRRLLGEPDDRQLMPGAACPTCDTAALALRTSAPPPDRIVECSACDGAWTMAELHGTLTA